MRWVLGDIHGMIGPLEAALDLIRSRDSSPRFYFVGDYVNRGPDARRVIELLLTLDNARFARGNHDDVLDLILSGLWEGGEEDAYDPLAACNWFLKHGLADTVLSYGIASDDLDWHRYHPSPDLLELIRSAIPYEHKQFIRNLPMRIDEPDALVMHAFWPPEEPNDPATLDRRLDDAETRHRVVWERYRPQQILASKPWTRPMFVGHTPVTNYPHAMRNDDNFPIRGPMITLLDTAAALGPGGRLSAVCIETADILQVDRHGQPVDPP